MTDAAPRFRQLTLDELDPAQRRVADEIVKFAGGIGGPFNLLLRSADLADLCFKLGSYVLFQTVLPRALVEMAILMRARWSGSELEWWAHRRSALAAGLSPVIADALQLGRRPDALSEDEAAVYDFCVDLLKHDKVADSALEAMRSRFGERGVADLTAIVGFYGLAAMILKVAEVGAPDGTVQLLPVIDLFA